MGFFDKLLVGGGVVLAGALARSWHKDAKLEAEEIARRKNSPLHFDDGVSEGVFAAIASDVGRGTTRVQQVTVSGMTVFIEVGSNSGLTTWSAQIDFNDYGHLTGAYWLNSDNSDSLIPRHFANEMQGRIARCIGQHSAGQYF